MDPRHTLLDIVKLDGRWAQIVSSIKVRFLADGSLEDIDWLKYEMVKDHHGQAVNTLIHHSDAKFSEAELQNIYAGPEGKAYPDYKLEVSVFGEYRKKPKD